MEKRKRGTGRREREKREEGKWEGEEEEEGKGGGREGRWRKGGRRGGKKTRKKPERRKERRKGENKTRRRRACKHRASGILTERRRPLTCSQSLRRSILSRDMSVGVLWAAEDRHWVHGFSGPLWHSLAPPFPLWHFRLRRARHWGCPQKVLCVTLNSFVANIPDILYPVGVEDLNVDARKVSTQYQNTQQLMSV